MQVVKSAQERYEYLLSKCDKNRGAYAKVKYDNTEEILWFTNYSETVNHLWFLEAPNCLVDYGDASDYDFGFINDCGLIEYEGKVYEIDSPQVAPFLPEELEIEICTEEDCLKWLISSK